MNSSKVYVAIATVFGVGWSPRAPGTAASLVALPFAWLIAFFGGRFALLAASILVAALGAWACEHYVHEKGQADPPECVIDEIAGQWLVCAFAPLGLLGYVFAFLLFRAFDIFKPWPIRAVERLPGGIGIMADDLVAGLFAGIVIAIAMHVIAVIAHPGLV
jgi:phosphatidylglycerophosphatase A